MAALHLQARLSRFPRAFEPDASISKDSLTPMVIAAASEFLSKYKGLRKA